MLDGVGIAESRVSGPAAGRDAVFRRMLAGADVVATATALAVMGLAVTPDMLTVWSLAALPLVVLAAKTMGLYDRDELVLHKTTLNEAPSLFHLTVLLTLLLTIGESALRDASAAPTRVLLLWSLLLFGILAARATARRLARFLTPKERCVLVGDIAHADRVRRMLQCSPELGAELVALIRFKRVTARGEDSEAFSDYLARSDFHRVIVTHNEAGFGEMLETIRVFKSRGIKVSLLPGLFDVLGSAVEFDDISGSTLLGVRRYGLSRSSQLLKRALDVGVSTTGLVVLAPVFAVVAAAVRLDSPGPVFFRQPRIGRSGSGFGILKFRTMCRDADARKDELRDRNETSGLFKLNGDPRVTRVGRLLRSASLDELPQLVNVLRGEMSLVGPRPLVLDEDSLVSGWHRSRLDLTPGMTGAWQTLRSVRLPLEEMVALDYLYIVNWSLWSDIQIMLRTIPHVFRGEGL